MKKILFVLLIMLATLEADAMDDMIKSECVSQVYNKSDFNPMAYGYMMGTIDGIITTQGMDKMNVWSSKVTFVKIMKEACKKTLSKDYKSMFYMHYRHIAYDVIYK